MTKGRISVWAAGLALLAAGGIAAAASWTYASSPAKPKITVWKSATCGCCGSWVARLRENGFDVKAVDVSDVDAVRAAKGVPASLQACHTAEVQGYVIEGHVPPDLIKELLRQRPDIAGLAVPGMPRGSPGMEGPYSDPYDVIAFDHAGNTWVVTHR